MSYLHDLCDHVIRTYNHGGRGSRIYFLRALFGCYSTPNCPKDNRVPSIFAFMYWYVHFASYKTSLQCYLHQPFIIHACLDDFQDFPTKSSFWYLISGSAFVFWCFRDLLNHNLIGDFYSINILSREAHGEVVAHERSHEAQTKPGGAATLAGCATQARLALSGCLASVFLWTTPYR
jgi:hypothetical protein